VSGVIGTPTSGVILHVPHGSREIPPDARASILLDDRALAVELDLMTDAHTALIASRAAPSAWLFVNPYSRLVVDPERFPDEREEMTAVGMGAVYTRTSQGLPLRSSVDGALLARYYDPYAGAMADLVDARLSAAGYAVILDIHSYPSLPLPYELHADRPRPAVCLGTDPFHTPAWLLDAASRAFAAVGEVGLDSPFSGCYVPLRHHHRDQRVSALMLEIRRDVYMREPGGPPTEELSTVVTALSRLISAITENRSRDRRWP
jgi:N-formylglutamate amidohydrolase